MSQTLTSTASRTWKADTSHSAVAFVARHMVVTKVRGHFSQFDATLQVAEGSIVPESIEATIEVESVDTRNADRDAHLRSADFFDAAAFPTITFRSTAIERRTSDSDFTVRGALTIHGVTKDVEFEAHAERLGKDPWGNERLGYEGSLRINREDFGLTWNQVLETGSVIVSKEIAIELEIQAIAQA